MNLENLIVRLHVFYILNTRLKFFLNKILFIIRSINLYFMHNLDHRNLKFKHSIDDIFIGL